MKPSIIKIHLTRIIIGSMIILIALMMMSFTVLQITEVERQPAETRLLAQWRTSPGDTFTLIWTHSVTYQPVTEVYRINDDLTIGIVEMLFNEHGPNLPSAPEGSTRWEIKDGMFRVYHYDAVFEELPVRIGQVVADHTFYYQEHTIALRELSRPGGYVIIRARRMNAVHYLFEEGRLWTRKN